jgi:neutral ceramidase
MRGILKKYTLLLILFLLNIQIFGVELKVGIGRKVITPEPSSIWMGGYASRTKPATGIIHDLWAKALVFEDSHGNHFIIITTDLIGISHQISEDVSKRIMEKYDIERSQLLINSSHNHSGPVILPSYFDFTVAELQCVGKYGQKLTDDIVDVVSMAWNDLKPMEISTGHGMADFGKNRRNPSIKIRPVDPDVPVLAVTNPDGVLKAVLFGYACHNTTVDGNSYVINGDYAGYAQIELEKRFNGITAMFFQGCGADIDPSPRGSLIFAEKHGKTMADVVQKVLSLDLQPVNSPIRTSYRVIDLDFKPLDIDYYKKEILSEDKYTQKRGRLMLEAYSKGWNLSKIQYPIQAIRFNDDLTIIGMGGEVVADYSLLIKKEYSKVNLFIAGYSNEVMCYIPTVRILKEGGYEPNSSMIYKGLPGPLAVNVEEKVTSAVRMVLKDVGLEPTGK